MQGINGGLARTMNAWSRGGDGPGAWPAASFNAEGRRICLGCHRQRCSASCRVQQLPTPAGVPDYVAAGFQGYGDTSSSGSDGEGSSFRQCRGTTDRGARCRVTSESPWASADPLKDGEHYCSRHAEQEFEEDIEGYSEEDAEDDVEPGPAAGHARPPVPLGCMAFLVPIWIG
jgi:hypothetical protein